MSATVEVNMAVGEGVLVDVEVAVGIEVNVAVGVDITLPLLIVKESIT